jgi:hypothetical protein
MRSNLVVVAAPGFDHDLGWNPLLDASGCQPSVQVCVNAHA